MGNCTYSFNGHNFDKNSLILYLVENRDLLSGLDLPFAPEPWTKSVDRVKSHGYGIVNDDMSPKLLQENDHYYIQNKYGEKLWLTNPPPQKTGNKRLDSLIESSEVDISFSEAESSYDNNKTINLKLNSEKLSKFLDDKIKELKIIKNC